MEIIYSDLQIDEWMRERKVLPHDWLKTLWNQKWDQRSLNVLGDYGNLYRIIVRDKYIDNPSFSVILVVYPNDNKKLNLRRYNIPRPKTVHYNPLERNDVCGPHIHKATERYQRCEYLNDDHYAKETNRFSDIHGAIQCLKEDANFQEVI